MDELLRQARAELEPPWDDLREARVLTRVLEAEAETRGPRWRRPVVAAALVAAVAVAVAAASLVWLRAPVVPSPLVASPQALPALVPARPGQGSLLALADGSLAHLEPGAVVQSLEQTPRVVKLLQQTGLVRYEVKHDATRPFTILARDVEVRVIGTVFTVGVEPDGVRVSVERGRVAVKSGARAVELAPGESLRWGSSEPAAVGSEKIAPTLAPETPSASPAPSAAQSPAALREAADQARKQGDLAGAERLLGRLVAEYPGSSQATSAAFSLGRIQSARGNFAGAAHTFESLRRRAPGGPLAEDAMAEAANAWALAGDAGKARLLAAEYASRYPGGPHTERMRRLGAP